MTRNEINVTKANIIGGMSSLVKNLPGQDDYYEDWIEMVPEDLTEEELVGIAKSPTFFGAIVEKFNTIMKKHKGGLNFECDDED